MIPEIAVVIAALILGLAAAGKIKVPLITKKIAPVALIIVVAFGVVTYDWGGLYTTWQEGAGAAAPGVDPVIAQGITLMSDGSESENFMSYDPNTRTFSVLYYENLADHVYWDDTSGSAAQITDAVFTITIRRTDFVDTENALVGITANVPTFYGIDENSGIAYQAIDRDANTRLFEVGINPAGVATRDEQNWVGIGIGASVAVVFTCDLDGTGLRNNNTEIGDSRDITISIDGLPYDYTLRFTSAGEGSY